MATEAREQTEPLTASPWLRAAKGLEGKAVICLGLLGVLGTVGEKYVGFLGRIGISRPQLNEEKYNCATLSVRLW